MPSTSTRAGSTSSSGSRPGRRAGTSPRTPGLRVMDVADAVKAADVVMILVPDTAQKAVYDDGDRARTCGPATC